MTKSNLLFITLLLTLISLCHNDPEKCKYQSDKDDKKGIYVDDAYFNKQDDDKKREQICHSLSHSPVNKDKCCYDKTLDTCVSETAEVISNTDRYDCPIGTEVHNSCGMAGVYQPFQSSICTEISLVDGYCCFVKSKIDGVNTTSCLRTKKINKDKNSETEQIKKYLEHFGAEFVEMTCNGNYLQILKRISFILGVLYYF